MKLHEPGGGPCRLLTEPVEHPPAPPSGLSVRQGRRWSELWLHPIASMWDPSIVGPQVLELIRMETGQSLTARELEHVSRLRRALFLEPESRRRARVALPTDPHAPPTAPAPTSSR